MNTIKMERMTGDFGFMIKDENGHILQTDSSIDNGRLYQVHDKGDVDDYWNTAIEFV